MRHPPIWPSARTGGHIGENNPEMYTSSPHQKYAKPLGAVWCVVRGVRKGAGTLLISKTS